VNQGRKAHSTDDGNKAKEEGGRGTFPRKDADRKQRNAHQANKINDASHKTYSAEERAAYGLKKKEEREAKKSGGGKTGYGGSDGKSYSAEEKAAYALKKKSEQASKEKKH
jgi:hypothetical protein